jgi:diacylglycerol kinase family enzyme
MPVTCIQHLFLGMHRHLLFIINPVAGTKSKDDLLHYIREKTTAAGFPFSFLFSTPSMKGSEILSECTKVKATDLVVCGGDGTVNIAARAIAGQELNLGIIPVGSGNGLARTAGIPMKPGAALKVVFNGHTAKTDAFLVNDSFSCMLTGLGLDAAVAESFAKSRKRGLFNYTTKSIVEFLKAATFPFTLNTGSLKIDSHAYFISIANSNQFGNNFTIAPKASLHDGLLDVVIVKKMWKVKMLYAIARQLNGGYNVFGNNSNPESEDILYLQTPSLTILNPSLAPMHIDGDPVAAPAFLNIRIIPDAFNLIVP